MKRSKIPGLGCYMILAIISFFYFEFMLLQLSPSLILSIIAVICFYHSSCFYIKDFSADFDVDARMIIMITVGKM